MTQNGTSVESRTKEDDDFRQKVYESFKTSFGSSFNFDSSDTLKVIRLFSRRYDTLGVISTHVIQTIDRSGNVLYRSWQIIFNGTKLAESSLSADEATSKAVVKFHADPAFIYMHQINKLEIEVDDLKQKMATLLNK
uniref:Uncharacterized protein n=1 Tax=Clandestinovirus TaxID=2831644 RepID=A0A8F8PR80_9VIRU|nr:hypothetical protein KOM_12_536 [Clandestinovirus]